MPGNPDATVYIGNLDEKVNDRVLYEIMIQAGQLIDFYIPRDKDTNRAKAYAFAEYETEEIADYAVRLFSGLVTLYNRTLKFAIAGQDRPNTISAPPMTTIASDSSPKLSSQSPAQPRNTENFQQPPQLLGPCRENFQQPPQLGPCSFSTHSQSASPYI
ncbi:hypothetical protein AAC387_Pa11g1785 [Persea americana]|eukprot:TRINITY_DN7651_c1_g1_i2.p1 TRINITY_DN7651_c1_g1~~TRINITY_DN7651_c1_g1_i2.p1  ORF type:complete len:159 (+),score=24.39 TRINITY_DN7651_c1_g1_i2:174-650(+)